MVESWPRSVRRFSTLHEDSYLPVCLRTVLRPRFISPVGSYAVATFLSAYFGVSVGSNISVVAFKLVSGKESLRSVAKSVSHSRRMRSAAPPAARPWIKPGDGIAWPRELEANCSESRAAFEFPAKGLWLFLRWGSFVPNWAYNYRRPFLKRGIYINRTSKSRRRQLQNCRVFLNFEENCSRSAAGASIASIRKSRSLSAIR